jgi:AraC-like DNA-binding protein
MTKRLSILCVLIFAALPSILGGEVEERRSLIDKLANEAVSYYDMCDYRKSYEISIRALDLCEQYGMPKHLSTIYTNIANIYYRFGRFDVARSYDLKALEACRDSMQMVSILTNLGGATEEYNGDIDSAFYYFNQALAISKRHDNVHLDAILTNIALYHQENGQLIAARDYFKKALYEAVQKQDTEREAEILSYQGKLFLEVGQRDSATHYLEQSNLLAEKYAHLWILADNHLAMSQLEELRGRAGDALEHFKVYAKLKDSIINTGIFSDINEFQRIYDTSKTNRQIEQLLIDKQIKQRTSHYQMIVIALLVLACVVFIFQRRKLNKAYKVLVAKNISIVERNKYKKSGLTGEMQRALMDKILEVMEDTATICDTEFSLDRLAELIRSNHAYVSQTINSTNRNFRSLLYEYRIREAQRLFLEPDTAKYTIETVSLMVGFKSRTAFREAFKEISGVSPAFYIKSMKEQGGAL